jgi:hypothetical protein
MLGQTHLDTVVGLVCLLKKINTTNHDNENREEEKVKKQTYLRLNVCR